MKWKHIMRDFLFSEIDYNYTMLTILHFTLLEHSNNFLVCRNLKRMSKMFLPPWVFQCLCKYTANWENGS